MELNENQQDYLNILISHIKKKVKEHKITPQEFKNNFNEIFTASHESYQNYIKGLLNDEEFKSKLAEDTWNICNK
jgi:hypothetical protein